MFQETPNKAQNFWNSRFEKTPTVGVLQNSENFRDNNIELINYLIATFQNESLLIDDIARLQN